MVKKSKTSISMLLASPTKDLKTLYKEAKVAYYNKGNSSLTDAEFDALEEEIRSREPKWSGLKKTGVKVGKKSEVTLDVPMPSLEKIQAGSGNKLANFLKQFKPDDVIFLPEKLDGSAIEATWLNGKLTKVATRGDGITGKDISFLIPYLHLPKSIQTTAPKMVFRFEAIMEESVYTKKFAGEYDSARALASAVLNRQDAAPALKNLNFVALRQMYPKVSLRTFYETMDDYFLLPETRSLKVSQITEERLVSILATLRAESLYKTDGLVLFPADKAYETTGDKPKYAKAFKVNDEANAPETRIKEIVWQPSQFGVLIPKAIIEPLQFEGVTVKQAALHNARWALDRGCGVGAVVQVLRSGDIIPKIVAVRTKKNFKLPLHSSFGEYEWDATKTQIVLINKQSSPKVVARQFVNFFSKLDLDGFSSAMAAKLVEAGYTETWQLTTMGEKNFARLPGVKASAKKYAAEMQRVRDGEFTIVQLMVASGCFDKGVGSTRLETLHSHSPSLLDKEFLSRWGKDALTEDIASIPGCGQAFAKLYVAALPRFFKWLDKSAANVAKPVTKKKVKGKLTGKNFSWTGYRSEDEEKQIEALGGSVIKFGGKTNVLFTKEGGKASGKIEKAEAAGIIVMGFTKFIKSV